MHSQDQLIGKTITGIIASPAKPGEAREIWMLQFDDGSHVEFVSPGARRRLRQAARRNPGRGPLAEHPQLALRVA